VALTAAVQDQQRYLSVNSLDSGADPGILERGGLVRGRSPEPSAEGASDGRGSGGLPQKILKN